MFSVCASVDVLLVQRINDHDNFDVQSKNKDKDIAKNDWWEAHVKVRKSVLRGMTRSAG